MASDPKQHRMEHLLQRWAQTRRRQIPTMQMTASTRDLLLAEAARTHRPSRAGLVPKRPSLWSVFWPRLGLATAFGAVILVCSLTWFRTAHSPKVDQSQPSAPASAPEPSPSETFVLSVNAPAAGSPNAPDATALQLESLVAPAPTAPTALPPSDAPAATSAQAPETPTALPKEEASPQLAARSLSRTAPRPAAQSSSSTTSAVRFQQMLSQRRNLNSPPMPNVLNSFVIEQSGDQLRVIDADGSIYEGTVQTAALPPQPHPTAQPSRLERSARNIRSIDPSSSPSPSSQLTFTVSGQNIVLNQPVTFSGRIITTNPAAPSQVEGKASIGTQQEVVIRANRSP